MKILKRITLLFLGIVVISIAGILYSVFKRETKEWAENIVVAPNTEVSVELMSSQLGYFGGHGLGWGGGNDKGSLEFKYNGINYTDELPYTLIALVYEKEFFYCIYYDRETDFNKIIFRFFKSTKKGSFEEIKASDFPKHLAIQNRWFSTDEKQRNTKQLKLDNIQSSLTAKVWYELEKGEKYYEMPYYIELNFLENYKRKYIE